MKQACQVGLIRACCPQLTPRRSVGNATAISLAWRQVSITSLDANGTIALDRASMQDSRPRLEMQSSMRAGRSSPDGYSSATRRKICNTAPISSITRFDISREIDTSLLRFKFHQQQCFRQNGNFGKIAGAIDMRPPGIRNRFAARTNIENSCVLHAATTWPTYRQVAPNCLSKRARLFLPERTNFQIPQGQCHVRNGRLRPHFPASRKLEPKRDSCIEKRLHDSRRLQQKIVPWSWPLFPVYPVLRLGSWS